MSTSFWNAAPAFGERRPPRARLVFARCAIGTYGTIGPAMTSDAPADLHAAFANLVIMLASAAAVHFGDLADAVSGQRQPLNLDGAAQMIELLDMLEEKTRGNLNDSEAHLLEQVLYELRLRFVEAQKSEKRIIEP